MKCILFCCLAAFSLNVCGQEISPGQISSAAGSVKTSSYNVEWVLAEVLVGSFDGSNFINGGILGSDIKYVVTDISGGGEGISLSSFPNPFSQSVTVESTDRTFHNATISLTDELGRSVQMNVISREKSRLILSTSHLSAGLYILSIASTSNNSKHYLKLIKK